MTASKRICKPFLKWPGGKQRQAEQIISHFPTEIEEYHEPFLGGGGVFFRLTSMYPIKQVFLNDINNKLMIVYICVRDELKWVLENLKKYADEYHANQSASLDKAKSYYLSVRNMTSDEMSFYSWPKIAARFIFLNKTCFNGLYRENKSGKFNVPFGQRTNPKIYDEESLQRASKLLTNAVLTYVDGISYIHNYLDTAKYFSKKCVFYLDPPYYSQDNEFTGFTQHGFDAKQQEYLASLFSRLSMNVSAYMSNANISQIHQLYGGNRFIEVAANRNIGGSSESRKKKNDLLILV